MGGGVWGEGMWGEECGMRVHNRIQGICIACVVLQ